MTKQMNLFGNTEQQTDKTLKVLSIDFDVFHDMTQFMPGAMQCQIDWVIEYSRWEGSFKHDFSFAYKDFEDIKTFLSNSNQQIYIAEDHKKLYDIINKNSIVEITNLDFHCDLTLCESLEKLDCGTWISALVNLKGCNCSIDWRQLHTKDPSGKLESFRSKMDTSIPYKHQIGFDGVFNKAYDIIFLCQSYEFSPPHLNHRFRELVASCQKAYIFPDSVPFYPTYSERFEYTSKFAWVYVPTGSELEDEINSIYDNHDNLVLYPVSQIKDIPDCDPWYRK